MLAQRMCSNILDADKVNPPKRTESGRVWTPAGVDLFRLLNEQVKVVQETSSDIMLFNVAVAINQVCSTLLLLFHARQPLISASFHRFGTRELSRF